MEPNIDVWEKAVVPPVETPSAPSIAPKTLTALEDITVVFDYESPTFEEIYYDLAATEIPEDMHPDDALLLIAGAYTEHNRGSDGTDS